MRFKVEAIEGPTIGRFENYDEAKAKAEETAYDYYYGTVVHDTALKISDWGDAWTETDDPESEVDAPDYA
jgi:hypothetical protein